MKRSEIAIKIPRNMQEEVEKVRNLRGENGVKIHRETEMSLEKGHGDKKGQEEFLLISILSDFKYFEYEFIQQLLCSLLKVP